MNGCTSTKRFNLEKGMGQRYAISAYLFIIVLEFFFLHFRENQSIKPHNIFSHDFLYTTYADDTPFFISNKNSVIELLNVFDILPVISELKPSKYKYEITGTGNLKRFYKALFGLKCINLTNETVKILGWHFSYNKTLQQENSFKKHVSKIENV